MTSCIDKEECSLLLVHTYRALQRGTKCVLATWTFDSLLPHAISGYCCTLAQFLSSRKAEETAQKTLKRLLSTKSGNSTSSSFAERKQAAIGSLLPFREIGAGSVGKVFEKPGTPWAFKVLLLDGTSKLWNHYLMHHRVQASFDQLGQLSGQVEIPRIAWLANKSSEFWAENLDLFPNESTFPNLSDQVWSKHFVLNTIARKQKAILQTKIAW